MKMVKPVNKIIYEKTNKRRRKMYKIIYEEKTKIKNEIKILKLKIFKKTLRHISQGTFTRRR